MNTNTTNVLSADIQKVLAGVNFPAEKQALIKEAKKKGASGEVMNSLNGISNREYMNSADVISEIEGDSGMDKEMDSDM